MLEGALDLAQGYATWRPPGVVVGRPDFGVRLAAARYPFPSVRPAPPRFPTTPQQLLIFPIMAAP